MLMMVMMMMIPTAMFLMMMMMTMMMVMMMMAGVIGMKMDMTMKMIAKMMVADNQQLCRNLRKCPKLARRTSDQGTACSPEGRGVAWQEIWATMGLGFTCRAWD